MALGVPLGIAAAHRPRLYDGMRPVLDLMQTLPPFVYLIPAIVFFGIGMVPGLIATVIFVVPAPIRLTHLGISNTPQPLLEAAQAFGATNRQTLWKVELPYALPQIMAGLNQTIMLSLSMVVIGALVVLGLFRRVSLVGAAIILVGGAFPIWRHFLDPFGRYLFASPEEANLLFFPSITVAGAALALIAFREHDTLALDSLVKRKG